MSQIPNQRVAYFNGEILPESEVRVSFRDRGFKFGEGPYSAGRSAIAGSSSATQCSTWPAASAISRSS